MIATALGQGDCHRQTSPPPRGTHSRDWRADQPWGLETVVRWMVGEASVRGDLSQT